jgi:outer membrane protein assembly factor BamB
MVPNEKLIYEKIIKQDYEYYYEGKQTIKHKYWNINITLIILLCIGSIATSVVIPPSGNYLENTDFQNSINTGYFNDWHVHEHINNSEQNLMNINEIERENHSSEDVLDTKMNIDFTRGPMDSPWSMQGHDIYHTCQSPYSTLNNQGAEIWRVHGDKASEVEGSAVIDRDGIIYFGTLGSDSSLYALYPNGTRKWQFHATGLIWGTPAIADDGTLYFTTWGPYHYFYALTSNGTQKWLFAPEDSCTSSPAIGEDGVIYFGSNDHFIYAINSNGTERWRYATGDIVMGSPAIDEDGNIYIGSCDHYLYALYPNGTLRWRFNTGSEIKGDASIADDGTIYIPAFNGYFYSLYSNGSLKWQASTGSSIAAAGVALAQDGTIYVGTEQLRAYYPNGILKWCINIQGSIYGTVPAVSADGTIYVSAGLSLVAVNTDGTEKWRKEIANQNAYSPPSIGEDGTVYVGSTSGNYGYLHAFGIGPLRAEAHGPYSGAMTESLQFSGEAFGGTPPYTYHWEFGDDSTSEDQNPSHIYAHRGNYTAIFTVTDIQGNQSQDTAQVTIGYPLPKISIIKPQNAVYFLNIRILPWRYPVVFGPIMIKAEASQVEIGIDRVEFYDDGKLIKTDSLQPYDCFWNVHPPPILHPIMVRVYDTVGNQNSITIYLNKWF